MTGHVTTSLGIDAVRTVVDSWRDELEGGPGEPLADLAAAHPSGMKVVSLTSSPLQTEILEPARVADAITAARRGFDFVVVDLHPSYSALNQAIFENADRILVPVTPDVPAIRAAVQLARRRDGARACATDWRSSSTAPTAACPWRTMERTVGMPALALIRSGGLLFVRAANEGRTVIEMFPKEKISEDFDALADRLLGTPAEPPAEGRVRACSAARRRPSEPEVRPGGSCRGARRPRRSVAPAWPAPGRADRTPPASRAGRTSLSSRSLVATPTGRAAPSEARRWNDAGSGRWPAGDAHRVGIATAPRGDRSRAGRPRS